MKKWSIPNLGAVVQVAYAVENLKEATVSWEELFGTGPFFIKEHIPLENVRVNGVTSTFDHSSAYAQWGPIMVELICEHNKKLVDDSNKKEKKPPYIHHCAVFVDDFKKASKTLKNKIFGQKFVETWNFYVVRN